MARGPKLPGGLALMTFVGLAAGVTLFEVLSGFFPGLARFTGKRV